MRGRSGSGRRWSSPWFAVCGALALTVVGCGGGGGSKPDAKDAKDAKGDTAAGGSGGGAGGGAGADGAANDTNTTPDTAAGGSDAAVDAPPDATPDTSPSPDGADATVDAPPDATTTSDAKDGGTDASVDATPDTGSDVAADTSASDTSSVDTSAVETGASDASSIHPLGPNDKVFWARSITGKDSEYVEDATIVSGDVVVVGDFSEEIIFAKGAANQTTYTTPKLLDTDVFFARYRADGSLVWAKRFGGADFDDVAAVAATNDGGFVLVGRMEGQVTFGAGETHETMLDAGAGRDLYVARFDGNGALAWAKHAGSASDSVGGSGVRVLADGSVVVAGYLVGSTVFGAGEANETTVAATGTYDDMFVARFTSAGALSWVKSGGAGGMTSTLAQAVAITNSTEATVVGYFTGTVVLGKGETHQTSLVSAGGDDLFIAHYALADGALVSAVRLGGTGDDDPHAAASNGDGVLTIAGIFSGSVAFGAGTGQTLATSGTTDYDAFVAQFAANGTLTWVRRAGGTDFDSAERLTLAADGTVYASGGFSLTAAFPSSTPAQLTASGPQDGFLARYASDGTPSWVRKLGGTGYDYGNAVALLPSDGSLVWVGAFGSSLTVGAGEANETILTTTGTHGDDFLVRMLP
jgi:hypothetical protein